MAVFADVEEHNGNLSPAAFEAAITERTKAVIPVHVGGIPADEEAKIPCNYHSPGGSSKCSIATAR